MTGPKFVVPILGIVQQKKNSRNWTKKYPDVKLEKKEHDLVPDLWLGEFRRFRILLASGSHWMPTV